MAKRTPRRRAAGTAAQSSTINSQMLVYAGIAVGVVILLGLLYISLREPPGIAGVITIPGLERTHDNTLVIDEGDVPQPGGPHHDAWLNCGVYITPVDDENARHSLEHGAVWVTYNDTISAGDIAELESYGRDLSYVIVSPYPTQESPVVLSAWGVQLEVDSAGDRRVEDFLERYRQGPQTPERGASCTGGVGTPVG